MQCGKCGTSSNVTEIHNCERVCKDCLDTKDYFQCEICEVYHDSDDRSDYDYDPVCKECYAKMPSEASHIMALTREFNQSRGI